MGVQDSINSAINSTARLGVVGKAAKRVKAGITNQEAQMRATENLNDKIESRERIMTEFEKNLPEELRNKLANTYINEKITLNKNDMEKVDFTKGLSEETKAKFSVPIKAKIKI